MSNLILYFTGSGNSLMVAKSLAMELGETEVIHFSSVDKMRNDTFYERMGLVFPVYYGGPPVIVVKTLAELKGNQGSYIFAVATHAGGPGQVLSHLSYELQNIGLTLSAGFDLGMPNNYILGYNAPSESQIESILSRADRRLVEIGKIVRSKADYPPSGIPTFSGMSKWYKDFIEQVKRFDERYWVDESCTECGICESVCPVRNITLKEGQPQWHHQCEMCLACLNWCPAGAIQYDTITTHVGRFTNPRVAVQDLKL